MPVLSTIQANLILTYVTLFTAYLISIALAGSSQAWIAKLSGDDSAEEAGFLTLNPIYHIHIVGAIMFVLFGIGLGPVQPVNLSSVWPRWKYLKLLGIYAAKPVVNIMTATISLISLLLIFGHGPMAASNIQKVKYLIVLAFTEGNTPLTAFMDIPQQFLNLFPGVATYIVVCGIILLALVMFNMLAASFNFVINGSYYALAIGHERQSRYVVHLQYFMIFGPFIVMFLFGGYVLSAFLYLAMTLATATTHLFGLG